MQQTIPEVKDLRRRGSYFFVTERPRLTEIQTHKSPTGKKQQAVSVSSVI